jgi:hypothetical protein
MKFALALVLISATTFSYAEDMLIFAGPDHKEFLGCLNCDENFQNSVWNPTSPYGWENGFGKWNPFGVFRSPFSSQSACNVFATAPPVIVDRSGKFYGTLSIKEFDTQSICSNARDEQSICMALKVMCKGN